MIISIIICTCNRSSDLVHSLAALGRVRIPQDAEVELLVVDNSSCGQTSQLVATASISKMAVHYVAEPRLGKSKACNAGLAAARGDIIVFIDDDIRPQENWLEELCQPLTNGTAEVVQGAIEIPSYLRRSWMKKFHLELLASTERLTATSDVPYLTGANIAFRRQVLSRVPAFDPELGPGALGFGEDSLFSSQLKRADFQLRYVPAAKVEHHFAPDRLTSTAFRQRIFRDGRSRAYVAHHWEHAEHAEADRRLLGARIAKVRHILRRPWRLRPNAVLDESEFWLYIALGFWSQFVIEKKRPRRYDKHGLILLNHAE